MRFDVAVLAEIGAGAEEWAVPVLGVQVWAAADLDVEGEEGLGWGEGAEADECALAA